MDAFTQNGNYFNKLYISRNKMRILYSEHVSQTCRNIGLGLNNYDPNNPVAFFFIIINVTVTNKIKLTEVKTIGKEKILIHVP